MLNDFYHIITGEGTLDGTLAAKKGHGYIFSVLVPITCMVLYSVC